MRADSTLSADSQVLRRVYTDPYRNLWCHDKCSTKSDINWPRSGRKNHNDVCGISLKNLHSDDLSGRRLKWNFRGLSARDDLSGIPLKSSSTVLKPRFGEINTDSISAASLATQPSDYIIIFRPLSRPLPTPATLIPEDVAGHAVADEVREAGGLTHAQPVLVHQPVSGTINPSTRVLRITIPSFSVFKFFIFCFLKFIVT